MASPFSTFRKNQKAWMVVLTILAMISFVFLGQMGASNRSASQADPEVFTWKYGTVHKSEIDRRIFYRGKVNQFLVYAGKAAEVPDQRISQNQYPVSERAIINALLLEKKAQQLGITISDQMVRQYIRNWTEGKVSRDELAGIIRGLSNDRGGISQAQLFDAIRFELASQYAAQAFSPLLVRNNQYMPFFRGDTPAERWDYFSRLNRKVTAEFLPVSVKDFVDQIADPSPSELQTFYEQYKNDEPVADSTTPGFRQPFKAQFEYVKADNAALLEKELASVTEQDIKDYYDKYKDDFFKKGKLPETPDKTDEKPDGQKADEPSSKKDDAAVGKTDNPSDAKTSETKPSESPAETKPNAKGNDTKSGATKATDSKSGASAPDAKSATKGDAKASASKAGGKSDTKAPSTKSGTPKAGDAKKGADGKQSSLSPSHTSLDGELLALADDAALPTQKPADTSKSETKPTDTSAAETKTPDAATADAAALPQRPVEYEPLDKVGGIIRNRLAQQRVDEKVSKDFKAIQSQMDRYRSSLDSYRHEELQGNTGAKKPTPPDLEALAQPYGYTVKKTEPVSVQQAYDGYDLGKSHRVITSGSYSSPPFYQIAYQMGKNSQPVLKLYQTDESEDNENNHYLWWKIAEDPAHTPPLESIKQDVIMAWKIVQGRKPASAKAAEYAAQVQKTRQPLKEAFAGTLGDNVISAGPFSWLTRPPEQPFAMPRLSTIKGIDHVGNDFMKAVFAPLKSGETGVAPNDPQTVFYVVQIENEEPSVDALRENFMTAMSDPMNSVVYAAIGALDHANAGPAWLKELAEQYDFKMSPGHITTEERDYD